jgi:tyrosyl-tRNA synthetase
METGISYTEFTYMLIQAYDFWHLWKTERCELQLGGSDQWGNITAGTELISRKEGAAAHGFVLPLLTTASGAKFGKSESGAIYLDPKKTSPYKFFQFWLNSEDADVPRWLRYFTFAPVEEIDAVMAEHAKDPGKRTAQRRLAEEMTTRIHGSDVCRGVVEASRLLFGGTALAGVGGDVLAVLADEIPSARVTPAELAALGAADALVKVGLATSKGDAKRGIQGKGFSLNGVQVADGERKLTGADLLAGRYVMLQKGKRSFALLVVEG